MIIADSRGGLRDQRLTNLMIFYLFIYKKLQTCNNIFKNIYYALGLDKKNVPEFSTIFFFVFATQLKIVTAH